MNRAPAHLREDTPPAEGGRPLEWMLTASVPVRGREDALETVRLYRLRWRIGDWHRILSLGCRVEAAQGRAADRIGRAVTVRAVIAWRLAAITRPGREAPELPTDLPFTETGIMAMEDLAEERGLPAPRTVGAALPVIAVFGGYMNRKLTSPPDTRPSGRDTPTSWPSREAVSSCPDEAGARRIPAHEALSQSVCNGQARHWRRWSIPCVRASPSLSRCIPTRIRIG